MPFGPAECTTSTGGVANHGWPLAPLAVFSRSEYHPASADLWRRGLMKRTLPGRRLLITGASGGIGRCLAEQAAARGARVALTARSADLLQELTRKLSAAGAEAVAIPADVRREEDRQRLVQ